MLAINKVFCQFENEFITFVKSNQEQASKHETVYKLLSLDGIINMQINELNGMDGTEENFTNIKNEITNNICLFLFLYKRIINEIDDTNRKVM